MKGSSFGQLKLKTIHLYYWIVEQLYSIAVKFSKIRNLSLFWDDKLFGQIIRPSLLLSILTSMQFLKCGKNLVNFPLWRIMYHLRNGTEFREHCLVSISQNVEYTHLNLIGWKLDVEFTRMEIDVEFTRLNLLGWKLDVEFLDWSIDVFFVSWK